MQGLAAGGRVLGAEDDVAAGAVVQLQQWLAELPPLPRWIWPTQTFDVTETTRRVAFIVWVPLSDQSAALPLRFISRSSERA